MQNAVQGYTPFISVSVPRRIVTRWGKHVRNERKPFFQYKINAALERANVGKDEFKKCWKFVTRTMSDEDLFNLFKQAGFGQPNSKIVSKINFVKQVMGQSQVMAKPVSLSCMPLMHFCLS